MALYDGGMLNVLSIETALARGDVCPLVAWAVHPVGCSVGWSSDQSGEQLADSETVGRIWNAAWVAASPSSGAGGRKYPVDLSNDWGFLDSSAQETFRSILSIFALGTARASHLAGL